MSAHGIPTRLMFGFTNINNVLKNLRKIKKELVKNEFLTLHLKKLWVLQNPHQRQVYKYFSLFLFPCLFPLHYEFTCSILMQSEIKSVRIRSYSSPHFPHSD